MAIAVPSFQKLQREGESGRRKINQWTRYSDEWRSLLFQGPTYLGELKRTAEGRRRSSAGRYMVHDLIYESSWLREVCLSYG